MRSSGFIATLDDIPVEESHRNSTREADGRLLSIKEEIDDDGEAVDGSYEEMMRRLQTEQNTQSNRNSLISSKELKLLNRESNPVQAIMEGVRLKSVVGDSDRSNIQS